MPNYNPANSSASSINIDLILIPWAKVHGLHVSREFTEEEDRFIQILDDAGDSYGVWISAPENDSRINIILSENAVNGLRVPGNIARTETFTTSISSLSRTLNEAYTLAESWMRERGHSRTRIPILSTETA